MRSTPTRRRLRDEAAAPTALAPRRGLRPAQQEGVQGQLRPRHLLRAAGLRPGDRGRGPQPEARLQRDVAARNRVLGAGLRPSGRPTRTGGCFPATARAPSACSSSRRRRSRRPTGTSGTSSMSSGGRAVPRASGRRRLTEDEKKSVAGEFLIRRVTIDRIGGSEYTKNLYRREWRRGGVESTTSRSGSRTTGSGSSWRSSRRR